MLENYRKLTFQEKNILTKILSIEKEKNKFYLRQIEALELFEVDETLFKLKNNQVGSILKSPLYALPIKCTYKDLDEQLVYIFLFANQENYLSEIEFWKPSGETIKTYFTEAELFLEHE